MIQQCPECKGSVSDQAARCPHCGHLLGTPVPLTIPKTRSAPVFMVLALFGLMVCLFTPRIIVALPILGTIACASGVTHSGVTH